MFARLFETVDFGQVLAVLTETENNEPAIVWYAQPPTLGVCKIAVSWEDSDEGWAKADVEFLNLHLDQALKTAKIIFNAANLKKHIIRVTEKNGSIDGKYRDKSFFDIDDAMRFKRLAEEDGTYWAYSIEDAAW